MPALANVRRELFCRNLIQGMSRPEAYERAGYKRHRQAAYLLLKEPEVKHRVFELLEDTETEVIVNVNTLTNIYVEILKKSFDDGDLKNAKGTTDSLAKMHGLMIERKEVGGVGEFTKMTNEQLIEFISARTIELGRENISGTGTGEEGEKD